MGSKPRDHRHEPDRGPRSGRRDLDRLHAQMSHLKGSGIPTVGRRTDAGRAKDRVRFRNETRVAPRIWLHPNASTGSVSDAPRVHHPATRTWRSTLPPEEEPGAPAAYGGGGINHGARSPPFWINRVGTDLHSKYSRDLPFMNRSGLIWQGESPTKSAGGSCCLHRLLLRVGLYAEQLATSRRYQSDPFCRSYTCSQSPPPRPVVVDITVYVKRAPRSGRAFLRRR